MRKLGLILAYLDHMADMKSLSNEGQKRQTLSKS